VTERIKINGVAISESQFTNYFWEVYDALIKKKSHELDLPSYFKFLQIMAFYIFVKEKVDVAIIEVGIGGQFDSTNILRNTELVGITALQLEHTQLLGNSLEEIAWQKAGIIKENSDVFYMSQPSQCTKVIQERSKELKAKSLSQAPEVSEYQWLDVKKPQFSSDINEKNFSLSLQLSAKWLKNRQMIPDCLFSGNVLRTIEQKFVTAFNKITFDGRFQKVKITDNENFYLDGAHTIDSMEICADWFSKKISDDSINVLVFNVTGDRDSERIMASLHSKIRFDYVCFTTNILNNDAYTEKSGKASKNINTINFLKKYFLQKISLEF
jgi:folylpolyglutamate synthase